MDQFFKFLSSNSPAALIFSIAMLMIAVLFLVMCAMAFLQGRSISLWPPSIGERPRESAADAARSAAVSAPAAAHSPVVGRGSVLEGASGQRYRVSSEFYGGAQATLYKATNAANETVIAKLYWRGLIPNSAQWQYFQHEQRALDVLNHRNIVRPLDRGLNSGYPFTIFEYFAGGTLRDWMLSRDRIAGADILSIVRQLGDAIDYSHAQGVLHRDIKPGNVMMEAGAQGRVALGDFGIAAVLGAAERKITATESIAGTVAYLAPELVQGAEPSTASDIYSCGVVLYELIARRVPFDDKREAAAMLFGRVTADAADIRTLRPGVPAGIAQRLAQTLSRNPADRPASAHKLLAGIEDELASLPL